MASMFGSTSPRRSRRRNKGWSGMYSTDQYITSENEDQTLFIGSPVGLVKPLSFVEHAPVRSRGRGQGRRGRPSSRRGLSSVGAFTRNVSTCPPIVARLNKRFPKINHPYLKTSKPANLYSTGAFSLHDQIAFSGENYRSQMQYYASNPTHTYTTNSNHSMHGQGAFLEDNNQTQIYYASKSTNCYSTFSAHGQGTFLGDNNVLKIPYSSTLPPASVDKLNGNMTFAGSYYNQAQRDHDYCGIWSDGSTLECQESNRLGVDPTFGFVTLPAQLPFHPLACGEGIHTFHKDKCSLPQEQPTSYSQSDNRSWSYLQEYQDPFTPPHESTGYIPQLSTNFESNVCSATAPREQDAPDMCNIDDSNGDNQIPSDAEGKTASSTACPKPPESSEEDLLPEAISSALITTILGDSSFYDNTSTFNDACNSIRNELNAIIQCSQEQRQEPHKLNPRISYNNGMDVDYHAKADTLSTDCYDSDSSDFQDDVCDVRGQRETSRIIWVPVKLPLSRPVEYNRSWGYQTPYWPGNRYH